MKPFQLCITNDDYGNTKLLEAKFADHVQKAIRKAGKEKARAEAELARLTAIEARERRRLVLAQLRKKVRK